MLTRRTAGAGLWQGRTADLEQRAPGGKHGRHIENAPQMMKTERANASRQNDAAGSGGLSSDGLTLALLSSCHTGLAVIIEK